MPDETSERAHLVLPDHTPLESLGRRGAARRACARWCSRRCARSTTRARFGDTLLDIGRARSAEVAAARCRRAASAARSRRPGRAWTSAPRSRAAASSKRRRTRAPGSRRLRSSEVAAPKLAGDGELALLALPAPLPRRRPRREPAAAPGDPGPDHARSRGRAGPSSASPRAERSASSSATCSRLETSAGAIEVSACPRGGIRDDVIAVPIGPGPHASATSPRRRGEGMPGVARGVNVARRAARRRRRRERRPRLAHREGEGDGDRPRTGACRCSSGSDNKRERQLGEAISLAALAAGTSDGARRAPRPARDRGEPLRRRPKARGATSSHERTLPRTTRRGRREGQRLPLGHDGRPRPLHGLQRLHRGLLRREQHPARRRGRDAPGAPDGVAAHRPLGRRRRARCSRPAACTRSQSREKLGDTDVRNAPMHVPALRRRAVRARLPGDRDLPQRGRPERDDLQPLHRHAVLRQQLPVQGAALQLLRPPAHQVARADAS